MATKKTTATATARKGINIHRDNILFDIVSMTKQGIYTATSIMQGGTPYNDNYKKAFEQQKKVFKELEKFEKLLEDCKTADQRALEKIEDHKRDIRLTIDTLEETDFVSKEAFDFWKEDLPRVLTLIEGRQYKETAETLDNFIDYSSRDYNKEHYYIVEEIQKSFEKAKKFFELIA